MAYCQFSNVVTILWLTLFLHGSPLVGACLATIPGTPAITTTTVAPVCCPAITVKEPPRIRAPIGTPGGGLDNCASLKREPGAGTCPEDAKFTCLKAGGTTVIVSSLSSH
ncbi:unnamed protein product [Anisakis simplex]|uniref:Uncharacterized protein n=1 Tax=Anisakis simplex TaxID=6269 RepID=A0A0M3JGI3_ANISI|nr:unnamed protein product [Anisakis simplex]